MKKRRTPSKRGREPALMWRLIAVLATLLFCSAALPLSASAAYQEFFASSDGAAKKILFIGNSYTYFNELPLTLGAMAVRNHPDTKLKVGDVVVGGATLESLFNQGDARNAIQRNGPWDFVVLQEQSARPVVAPQLMYDYVDRFAADTSGAGARLALYETWSDKLHPEGQEALSNSYTTAAARTNALLVRVGDAFRVCLKEHPEIDLYNPDNHHPGPYGTYLAACLFYEKLFNASCINVPCDLWVEDASTHARKQVMTVPVDVARNLQAIARRCY